jgi:hypothetical protein
VSFVLLESNPKQDESLANYRRELMSPKTRQWSSVSGLLRKGPFPDIQWSFRILQLSVSRVSWMAFGFLRECDYGSVG